MSTQYTFKHEENSLKFKFFKFILNGGFTCLIEASAETRADRLIYGEIVKVRSSPGAGAQKSFQTGQVYEVTV